MTLSGLFTSLCGKWIDGKLQSQFDIYKKNQTMKHIQIYENFHVPVDRLEKIINKAMMDPENSTPILLTGPPGSGKAAAIASVLDAEMIVIDCEFLTMQDLVTPSVSGGRTRSTPNQILPVDNGPDGAGGAIVFEDIDRCNRQIQQFVLNLAMSREASGYSLPDGWIIIATAGDGGELDSAMQNRFFHVQI